MLAVSATESTQYTARRDPTDKQTEREHITTTLLRIIGVGYKQAMRARKLQLLVPRDSAGTSLDEGFSPLNGKSLIK